MISKTIDQKKTNEKKKNKNYTLFMKHQKILSNYEDKKSRLPFPQKKKKIRLAKKTS